MKKIIISLILLIPFMSAHARFVQEGMYVHGLGGVAFPQNPGNGIHIHTGINLGAGVGIKQGHFRYEGEFNWQRSDSKFVVLGGPLTQNGNANLFALMANIHYDFDEMTIHPQIVPSIGVGIGWANVFNKWYTPFGSRHKRNELFAYQVLFNVHYHFTSALSVNVGYKYFGTTSFDYIVETLTAAGAQQVHKTWQSHMLNVGASFRFG